MSLPLGFDSLNAFQSFLLIALLLYLAGIFLNWWGLLIGFFISLFGMPFAVVEQGLGRVIKHLVGKGKSLFGQDIQAHQNNTHEIMRNVFIALLGLAVVAGTLITLLPVLPFVIGSGVSVVNVSAFLTGALLVFLGSIILLVEILLELWELSSVTHTLVSRIPQRRLWKVLLSLPFAIFLLITVLNFILVGLLKAYLLRYGAHSLHTLNLQGTILVLTEAMVLGSGVVGILAMVRSLLSLAGMFLYCIVGLCGVVFLPFWFVAQICHWLAYFPSQGRLSPYMVIPKPGQLPAGQSFQLPWWKTHTAIEEEEFRPSLPPSKEGVTVSNKINSVIITGARVAEAAATYNDVAHEPGLRPARVIRTSGTHNMHGHMQTPLIRGTDDISPDVDVYNAAFARGMRGEQLKEALYERMAENFEQKHSGLAYEAGAILIHTDIDEIPAMEKMLRRMHEVQPFSVIWILLELAKHERKSQAMQKATDTIQKLFGEKVIMTCTLLSVHSYTYANLLRHVAKTVLGMLVMKEQFPAQPGIVQVLNQLASNGTPISAMRHASETVIPGEVSAKHWWQRGMKKGASNVRSMVNATQRVILEMAKNPDTGSIELPIRSDLLNFILRMVPIPGTDKAKTIEYISLTNTIIQAQHARPLFLRTVGEPTHKQLTGGYVTAASWLYSLALDDLDLVPEIAPPQPKKALPEYAQAKEPASEEPEDELASSQDKVAEEDIPVPTQPVLEASQDQVPQGTPVPAPPQSLDSKTLDALVKNFIRYEKSLVAEIEALATLLQQMQSDPGALITFIGDNLNEYQKYLSRLLREPTWGLHAFYTAKHGFAIRYAEKMLHTPLLEWPPLLQQLFTRVSNPGLQLLVKEDLAQQTDLNGNQAISKDEKPVVLHQEDMQPNKNDGKNDAAADAEKPAKRRGRPSKQSKEEL